MKVDIWQEKSNKQRYSGGKGATDNPKEYADGKRFLFEYLPMRMIKE
ncbi:hypothetical protein MASR2M69_05910 [Bacteroidota bacterium]